MLLRSDTIELSLGRLFFCSRRERRFCPVSFSMLTDRDRRRCAGGEALRFRAIPQTCCDSALRVPGFNTENPEFTSRNTVDSGLLTEKVDPEKLELVRRTLGSISYDLDDPSVVADCGSPQSTLDFSVEGVLNGLDFIELDDPGGVVRSVELRGSEKLTISPDTIGAKLAMPAQSPLCPALRVLGTSCPVSAACDSR